MANGDQVKPFIHLFRSSLKLKTVYVNGITHKPTIRKLRKGLLPKGGRFEIHEWRKNGSRWLLEVAEHSDEE